MPLLQPPAPHLRPSELTYIDAYNSIISRVRRTSGSGSGGVVIIVGIDVDGLLAARILASMFKQDDVPYRLVPVGGYAELEAKRDEAMASEELHTLILLSLGSLLPLSTYFELPPGRHLHIIDAHRPWNLQNLFGLDVDVSGESSTGRIWVWGDGEEGRLDGVKRSWEALEYEPSDSESDSDEDEEEDDEEDEAEEEEEEDVVDGEGSDEGEREQQGESSRKRASEGSVNPRRKKRRDEGDDDRPRRLPRAVRQAHYDRIQKYYDSGTSSGMSVSQTIYLLATVLERADNDLLWLAILSITYQYCSSRIDREQYEAYHELFTDEVVRLNAIPTGSKVPNPDDRSIARSDELRFTLFRSWNLYDAMLHSAYVAGRLGIWREKGRKRLQGLLAKMGFSLQQCQQAYAHMDMDLKKHLPSKLESIAPEYGLIELSYPSFTRAFGFTLSSLSAADAVEGISALLEAAKGVRLEVEKDGGRRGGEWFGGTRPWNVGRREEDDKENLDPRKKAQEEEKEDGVKVDGKKDQAWHIANFWIAFDALSEVSLLRRSLPLAMTLHRSIIRQGSSLLEKAAIRPLRTFRFCAIREGPDLRLFSHPSTLSRLALWLVNATRDKWAEKDARSGKAGKALPFVVACLNEDKGTYLVVGVTGAPEFGDVRKNKFGLAFQEAAEESGAGAKHDMFDTSVVEVRQADLTTFIESLHLRSA